MGLHWIYLKLLPILFASLNTKGIQEICNPDDLKEAGVQAAAVGSDVHLICNNTEHDVQWNLNGEVIPESVNHVTRDGHLNLTDINLEANGTYTCRSKRSGAHLYSSTLLVGYPPKRPSLSCRSPNVNTIQCTWSTEQNNSIPTKYVITCKISENEKKCVFKSTNTCTIEANMQFLVVYKITVTSVNELGCSASETLTRHQRDILQPDPCTALQGQPVQGEDQQIWVTWQYPPTWMKHRGLYLLRFKLQYKATLASRYQEIITDKTEYVIMDARPGAQHVLLVSGQDKYGNGQWSIWSQEVIASPWKQFVTVTPTGMLETKTHAEYSTTGTTDNNRKSRDTKTIYKVFLLVAICIIVFLLLVGVVALTIVLRRHTLQHRQMSGDRQTQQRLKTYEENVSHVELLPTEPSVIAADSLTQPSNIDHMNPEYFLFRNEG
uniref:ciliary neurotrophic factor receptor subunit alpha-like isoform X1 n=1 Tax=Myxine glutinosa TaxID=7769 RepID=UPI00358EBE54